MQEYTEEQFLEKYASLPQELKTAMSSVESSDIIQAISKKHELQIDQMGELASETGFVLLGFTKPEEYIRNLKNRLQVDPKKAKEIALEVNSQIFSKVKESLKRQHGIGGEEKKETVSLKNDTAANIPNTNTPTANIATLAKTKSNTPVPKPSEINNYISSLRGAFNETKNALPQEQIKTNSSSPLELIKKHEDETAAKSENEEKIKKIEDFSKTPSSSFINIMPNINNAPKEELKNQISRYAKQTTEIKLSEKKKEDKNTPFKNEHYPEGDPYKEPI